MTDLGARAAWCADRIVRVLRVQEATRLTASGPRCGADRPDRAGVLEPRDRQSP